MGGLQFGKEKLIFDKNGGERASSNGIFNLYHCYFVRYNASIKRTLNFFLCRVPNFIKTLLYSSWYNPNCGSTASSFP